jgi:hypothetical protein
MRESRTSGFVRGARSNMCPYRDPDLPPIFRFKSWTPPNPQKPYSILDLSALNSQRTGKL